MMPVRDTALIFVRCPCDVSPFYRAGNTLMLCMVTSAISSNEDKIVVGV